MDVSKDPAAVNGCNHIFCRTCIDPTELKKCPNCQAGFEDPEFESIKGTTAHIYYDLRMECINPSCDKTMTTLDYKYHDDNCAITFDTCKDCEIKFRRGSNNDHSCIKVLKAELDASGKKFEELDKRMMTEVENKRGRNEMMETMMKEMEKKMKREDEMKEMGFPFLLVAIFVPFAIIIALGFRKPEVSIEKFRDEVNGLKKGMNEEGVSKEIEIMIKNERERMEHLIHLTIAFRAKLTRYDNFPWQLVPEKDWIDSKQTFRRLVDFLTRN